MEFRMVVLTSRKTDEPRVDHLLGNKVISSEAGFNMSIITQVFFGSIGLGSEMPTKIGGVGFQGSS